MRSTVKIIFWLAVVWIVFCLIFFIAGQLLPIEFSSSKYAHLFYTILWLTLPVAILLTLVDKNKARRWLRSPSLRIIIAIVTFVFFGIFLFGKTLCGYGSGVVLFVDKEDTAVKIVERSFGCGAYDSDLPKSEFVKVKPLTGWLRYVKHVDTAKLDRRKWVQPDTILYYSFP